MKWFWFTAIFAVFNVLSAFHDLSHGNTGYGFADIVFAVFMAFFAGFELADKKA